MYDTWNPAELNEAVKNASGSGNGLPVVDPTDEGKVLTVNSSGEWEAADPSASGYEIKEEEIATGITFMGKMVYCRKYNFGSASIGGNTTLFAAPENIELIDALMDTFDTNTHFISHPTTYINKGNVIIHADYTSTVVSGTIVLYYTKVTTETKTTRKKTK